MRKAFPYIFLVVAVIIIAWLFGVTSGRKVFNDRLSFRRQDKIPYGLYVAYHGLERVFPKATISINRSAPAYWDSLSAAKRGQALIIVCPGFDATRAEMDRGDAEYAAPWTLRRGGHEVFTMPRVAAFRTFVINHTIHHRGQLSVYLRLHDVPLPSIYGPTADER